MPLDGHSYLVAQGWSGVGTGLRQGAISRPLAIPQKKTLAGLGKDRDEAFPFWDHLFSAAAKSIQVKCFSDDENDSGAVSDDSNAGNNTMKRTSTGILSTRRPVDGTSVDSGTATPDNPWGSQTSRLSLMALAKRDAARSGLYSRFFRGPVLGPDTIAEDEKRLASLVSDAPATQGSDNQSFSVVKTNQTVEEGLIVDVEASNPSKKRQKKEKGKSKDESEKDVERRERKRRRKEEKEKERNLAASGKRHKQARHPGQDNTEEPSPSSSSNHERLSQTKEEIKADRIRRKEKKKKRLRPCSKVDEAEAEEDDQAPRPKKPVDLLSSSRSSKHLEVMGGVVAPEPVAESNKKQKKKKRKRLEETDASD
ncbi:hypothetical protein B0H34DRAFT_797760 [Crassisporium funariophilum]|nr:hypothetical protein B0H34DRAFT_797760 [Crassisporium funariophilum]